MAGLGRVHHVVLDGVVVDLAVFFAAPFIEPVYDIPELLQLLPRLRIQKGATRARLN